MKRTGIRTNYWAILIFFKTVYTVRIDIYKAVARIAQRQSSSLVMSRSWVQFPVLARQLLI